MLFLLFLLSTVSCTNLNYSTSPADQKALQYGAGTFVGFNITTNAFGPDYTFNFTYNEYIAGVPTVISGKLYVFTSPYIGAPNGLQSSSYLAVGASNGSYFNFYNVTLKQNTNYYFFYDTAYPYGYWDYNGNGDPMHAMLYNSYDPNSPFSNEGFGSIGAKQLYGVVAPAVFSPCPLKPRTDYHGYASCLYPRTDNSYCFSISQLYNASSIGSHALIEDPKFTVLECSGLDKTSCTDVTATALANGDVSIVGSFTSLDSYRICYNSNGCSASYSKSYSCVRYYESHYHADEACRAVVATVVVGASTRSLNYDTNSCIQA